MTKSQIWISALLGFFLILFGISYLTEEDLTKTGSEAVNNSGEEYVEEQSAMTLIKNNACTSCHGPDLRGSNLGPSLINMKKSWNSREQLISYLRNPNSFMDKDRFKQYKEKYSAVVMPPFNHLDIKELGKIADYLLAL